MDSSNLNESLLVVQVVDKWFFGIFSVVAMKSRRDKTLDAIDWKLIEALQIDARTSLSALGKTVGLSQPAVSERVKRLESLGIIEGYSARINYTLIGLDLLAIIRVKTTFDKLPACLKYFSATPEILEVYRVTGEDCLILKVVVARASQLEVIVDKIAKYGSATTSIVLSSRPPNPVTKKAVAAFGN
jgi:Lrp/AsnC family leucine-responsive transcriptional regulator